MNGKPSPFTISPPFFVGALFVLGAVLLASMLSAAVVGFRTTALEPSIEVSAQVPTVAHDYDHDGTADTKDGDDDNDGWADIDDPVAKSGYFEAGKWYANLDNDSLARGDPDEDNDGTLDTKDKFPYDQNNNKVLDTVERKEKGARFDGDRDGVGDLVELRKVALAEAQKLGIQIPHTVQHLADIPTGVFQELPDVWKYVCQDHDDDGDPDAHDRWDYSLGGSYAAYTHDGKAEDHYARYAAEWQTYGFVGAGAVGQDAPRFTPHSDWVPAGYTPGAGFTGTATGGAGDPYASFYGSVTHQEQQHYSDQYQTSQTTSGGTTSDPYSQYTSTSTGGAVPPPTTDTHSTEPPPPPPSDSSTSPPPAPPPDSGMHY